MITLSGERSLGARTAQVPWWFNESYCANAAVGPDPPTGPGDNGWVSLDEWCVTEARRCVSAGLAV